MLCTLRRCHSISCKYADVNVVCVYCVHNIIIAICRSYGRPPAMVVHVMNAVCLLLGQPTDWKTVKQLTRDGTVFLKMLYSYDKENIPEKVITVFVILVIPYCSTGVV